jgi:hypothetical protein
MHLLNKLEMCAEKPGFSEKPGFFPRIIEMIHTDSTVVSASIRFPEPKIQDQMRTVGDGSGIWLHLVAPRRDESQRYKAAPDKSGLLDA